MTKRPHDDDDDDKKVMDDDDDIKKMVEPRPPVRTEAHWQCEVCGKWHVGSHLWTKEVLNGNLYWMCVICQDKFTLDHPQKEDDTYVMKEKKDDEKDDDNDGGRGGHACGQ